MKKLPRLAIIILICLFTCTAFAQPSPLPPSRQLMVVVTDGWNNLQGTIYVFEKDTNKWILKFSNAIVIGSKGLGVGDGIIPISIENAPIKKEGDMKSPAGFFTIGTAFGYADYKEAKWINNPYVKATDTLICVDDMNSAHYNTLINNDTAKSDYKSFEHMHLQKDYYKWGLFINHNSPKVVPGDGSCVFMHIWGNDHSGTAGCTAMKEEDLLKILRWIKASDNPLLVQLPKDEYLKIRVEYGLPEIGF
ncbi:MAG TPA: L,D-transpeptidase family protein [Mucilaginibacter sp.]|jgi:D-alanyl-D-alanine dipeptidase